MNRLSWLHFALREWEPNLYFLLKNPANADGKTPQEKMGRGWEEGRN
jgi:hypothetical protein